MEPNKRGMTALLSNLGTFFERIYRCESHLKMYFFIYGNKNGNVHQQYANMCWLFKFKVVGKPEQIYVECIFKNPFSVTNTSIRMLIKVYTLLLNKEDVTLYKGVTISHMLNNS